MFILKSYKYAQRCRAVNPLLPISAACDVGVIRSQQASDMGMLRLQTCALFGYKKAKIVVEGLCSSKC